jgi:hypothetical protein
MQNTKKGTQINDKNTLHGNNIFDVLVQYNVT